MLHLHLSIFVNNNSLYKKSLLNENSYYSSAGFYGYIGRQIQS